MKILEIPTSYPNLYNPNSAPFFRDQAFALQSVGNELAVLAVLLVSFKEIVKKKKLFFCTECVNDSGIITWRICIPAIPKLRWLNNKIRTAVGTYIYKKKVRKEFKPQFLHVHTFLAGDIAINISKKYNIPYAITEHSTGFARNTYSNYQLKQARRVFQNAKLRIAVSEPFAELLKKKFSLSFQYVPNVIDFREIDRVIEETKTKNSVKICNVAYLDYKKRPDRLIRAFHSVNKQISNIELHIAGDGPEMSSLKALAKKLAIEDKVFFYGKIPRHEVFKLMKSCDVFALSSDYETFGVVLIEAMACGLPVIATKCGGPESIVKNYNTGILVEKEQDSFAKGLKLLITDYNKNKFCKDDIKKHVQDNYSYFSIGEKLNIYFTNVVEENKRNKYEY